jgi:outer membrane protein TolC
VIPDELPEIQSKRKVADSLLNPALAELDRKIEAARGAERLAMKEGLPNIGVGLDYALIGKRTDAEVPENGRDVLMPMVSLSLPVYRNKYRAKAEESRNRQQELQAEQTATRNRLRSQLAQSQNEQDKLQLLLSQYKRQVQLINRTLNLLLVEYSNQQAGIGELLRVQATLLKYQRQQIEATMAWWINRATIQVITGTTYTDNEEEQ